MYHLFRGMIVEPINVLFQKLRNVSFFEKLHLAHYVLTTPTLNAFKHQGLRHNYLASISLTAETIGIDIHSTSFHESYDIDAVTLQ